MLPGQRLHGGVLAGLAPGDLGAVHQPVPGGALPVRQVPVLGVERGQVPGPRTAAPTASGCSSMCRASAAAAAGCPAGSAPASTPSRDGSIRSASSALAGTAAVHMALISPPGEVDFSFETNRYH